MGTVGIVGLGLIGGSIGLALKRSKLAGTQIVGYDRDLDVALRAQRFGAVDGVGRTLAGLADTAGLIVIATPIVAMRGVFAEIGPRLQQGAVVTDVASTKGEVLRWASELLPAYVHFVGGHPMAGKEQTGPQAAEAGLFDGRPYCIVPSLDAHPGSVNAVMGLAEAVGGVPFFLDADEHDAYAAAISHVPLVASVALFSLARNSNAWPELASMAGTGFKDLTRLASGSPEMSHDIFLTNKKNLGHWIDRYIGELLKIRDLIESDDPEAIFRAVAEVQIEREEYLANPPRREVPGDTLPDMPSPQQAFLNLLAGSMWMDRAREMTQSLEERARQRDRDDRLRRRE